MAIKDIPTGIVFQEVVDKLPKKGDENIVYRKLIDPNDENQFTDDFIYYDDEWHEFSFDAQIFGAFFEKYQKSVAETIADLEARVEALEDGGGGGDGKVLFQGSDIELTEMGATIGKRINVQTDVKVTAGTVFKVELKDMTVDGEPIDDVSGEITAYQVPSWDWQGGELYTDVFGNNAYFAFGTEPKDNTAKNVTLGFVNEGDGFDIRTLTIGHIKVEVD